METFLLTKSAKLLVDRSSHKVELVFCQDKVTLYGLLLQAGTPVTVKLAGVVFWTAYAREAEQPEPVPLKLALKLPELVVLH